MNNKVSDESNDRKYFNQTPFIVWLKCSDPYEYALWNVIKMIAGESKECYLTTNDLATLSMMSVGKVSTCRESLLAKGLIVGEKRVHDGHQLPVWHLRIPDLWLENVTLAREYPTIENKVEYKKNHAIGFSCGEKPSSPYEKGFSPHEKPSSPYEKPTGGSRPPKNQNKNHKEKQEEEGGDRGIQDQQAQPEQLFPPTANLPLALSQADDPNSQQATSPKPIPLTGDPCMDASINKFNGNGQLRYDQVVLNGVVNRYQKIGLTGEQFNALVDAYLEETCQKKIADGNDRFADEALQSAQEFTASLIFIGKRFHTEQGVRLLFRSIEKNHSWMRKPSAKQLLQHAEEIVSNKVEHDVYAEPADDEPEPKDPSKWVIRDSPDYKPKVEPVISPEHDYMLIRLCAYKRMNNPNTPLTPELEEMAAALKAAGIPQRC